MLLYSSRNEVLIMKNNLSVYEVPLGRSINLQKYKIYCRRNVQQTVNNSIDNTCGVQQVLGT